MNRRPEGARGPGHATTLTPKELFAGFFAIGVQGFGGVLFWARRVLPVTIGLTLASAYLVTLGAGQSPGAYIFIACTAAAVLGGRMHPLWPIGVGGLLGYAGVI